MLEKFKKIKTELKYIIFFFCVILIWMLVPKSAENKKEVINNTKISYDSKKSVANSKNRVLSFTGISKAEKEISLISEVNGKVEELKVKNGERLKKNDIILNIEKKSALEKYNSAKENLASKKVLYKSSSLLKKGGLGSESIEHESKANLHEAEAQMKQAALDLQNTNIIAPYDGFIDYIEVKVGDHLTIGGKIAQYVADENIRINFDIPENAILDLNIGDKITFTVNGKDYESQVDFIGKMADNLTKMYNAGTLVNNENLNIKSGQLVPIKVYSGNFKAHKVSQSTVVIDSKGELGVKILDSNNIVKFIPVKIINEDTDGFWLINLPEEAVIITRGAHDIPEGEKLTPNS
ncbi:MAG: multidrug efflux system membrane fusion protein [Candidatus Midichloriaceae bacterium]|jgi:multidrug efflux system membrane fusion protein